MKTPPLTSAQQHCMATPRRGNLVHKLTENFRDPAQLEHTYYRSISAQKLAKFQADFFALPAISFEQNINGQPCPATDQSKQK